MAEGGGGVCGVRGKRAYLSVIPETSLTRIAPYLLGAHTKSLVYTVLIYFYYFNKMSRVYSTYSERKKSIRDTSSPDKPNTGRINTIVPCVGKYRHLEYCINH